MTTFSFTYDPGVTLQQALGFEMAGRIWSSYLSDAVTLNIHVGISNNLPTNVIGGALPAIHHHPKFDKLKKSLDEDVTSADDLSVSKNILGGADYKARFDFFSNGVHGSNEAKTKGVNLTRANAKALGLEIGGNSEFLDGVILLSDLHGTGFTWGHNYVRSQTAARGSLDFLSVALHEIGHILGFVSGVDKPGWINSSINTKDEEDAFKHLLDERVSYTSMLDLFRYSSWSSAKDRNDLSYGEKSGSKFFSIDGGQTAIAHFASGKETNLGGDGYQASHWKNGTVAPGIMDPAISPTERVSISSLDLRAFDVMGWNLRNGQSVTPLTTPFLSTIRDQALQSLGQRIGQGATWVAANLNASPATLVRERTADVEAMIRDSKVYEWGTSGSGTTSTSGRRWMEIFNHMAGAQSVYLNFSTLSPSETSTRTSTKTSNKTFSESGSNSTVESTPEQLTDPILGMSYASQLTGIPASEMLNQMPGSSFSNVLSLPSLTHSGETGQTWQVQPLWTKTGGIAPETSSLSSLESSHLHLGSMSSSGLDSVLGVSNNPLIHTALISEFG